LIDRQVSGGILSLVKAFGTHIEPFTHLRLLFFLLSFVIEGVLVLVINSFFHINQKQENPHPVTPVFFGGASEDVLTVGGLNLKLVEPWARIVDFVLAKHLAEQRSALRPLRLFLLIDGFILALYFYRDQVLKIDFVFRVFQALVALTKDVHLSLSKSYLEVFLAKATGQMVDLNVFDSLIKGALYTEIVEKHVR